MPLNLTSVRERFPLRLIQWHETIGSTMPEAVRLAAEGAPSGSVIGAEEQTAGHGRYNRVWHSEKGSGLYQSIVLRLSINPASLPVVTLALGLATQSAIARETGIACDLRWPNDVLIGDLKCAGILVQLHGEAVVAGIGINVNQKSFPPDLPATSVLLASGSPQSREALLIALLEEIDTHCEILVEQGTAPILGMFAQSSSYVSGRRVIVDDQLTGTTSGLTQDGFLLLRSDSGQEQIIHAGGVRMEGGPAGPRAANGHPTN